MKTTWIIILGINITQTLFAQQWSGSSDLNGTLSRNGNVVANGLSHGRYGNALSGDSNPYAISSADGEEHDLIIYGSNAATLHLRMYDGDIKLGSSSTPNSVFYNNGNATLAGNLKTGSYINAKQYITVEGGQTYRIAINGQTDSYVVGRNTSDENKFLLHSNGNSYLNGGNVGIGTITPLSKLHVNGNMNLDGNAPLPTDANANSPNNYVNNYNFKLTSSNNGFYMVLSNTFNERKVYLQSGHNDTGYAYATGPICINPFGGNVGIGTTSPDAKLAVKGTIHTQEVKVDMNGWSDFVFEPNYKLQSLESIADYIKSNKHLPDVPSAKEVEENGVNLGEMNKILLQKIEELTLHMIELKKENEDQRRKSDDLEGQIKQLIHNANEKK